MAIGALSSQATSPDHPTHDPSDHGGDKSDSSGGDSDESDGFVEHGSFSDLPELLQQLVQKIKQVKKQVKKVQKENSLLRSELNVSVSTLAAIQSDIGHNSVSQLTNTSLWHSIVVGFKRQNQLDQRVRSDLKAEMSQMSKATKANVASSLQALEALVALVESTSRMMMLVLE